MILYRSGHLDVFKLCLRPGSSYPLIIFLGLGFFDPITWIKNDHGDSGNRLIIVTTVFKP